VLAKGGVGLMSAGRRWRMRCISLWHALGAHQRQPAGAFIYLARQVDPAQAKWIDKLNLPGINLRDESRRFYPAGMWRRT
jgi:cell division protein FtsI (penicillin-binding protein 3)